MSATSGPACLSLMVLALLQTEKCYLGDKGRSEGGQRSEGAWTVSLQVPGYLPSILGVW